MARILVIDDDVWIRSALAAALRNLGHDVKEAQDGKEGLQLHYAEPGDVVLTDIVMPEKEGLDVIRRLHADFPAVRIIAMSGYFTHSSGLYLHLAKKLGAHAVLAKPVEVDLLRRTVDTLLADASQRGA